MRRAGEIGIALLLALALHLAAFAGMGGQAPAGLQSAGQGGADLVSLAAADAATARLLAAWDSPPPVVTPAALAAPQPQETPPPQAPSAMPPPAVPPRIAPEQIALPSPAGADSTPRAAEAPPPPPPPPEPPGDTPPRSPPPEPPPPEPPPPRPASTEPAPAQPRDAPSAEAAPAQQAAGSGAQSAAGTEGAAPAAATGTAEAARLTTRWGAEIRARIERRTAYPREGAGASGTVTLRLTVGADGRLRAVGIAASSGSAALDQAALRAVERAGRFPRAPRALGEGGATFTLPVTFRP